LFPVFRGEIMSLLRSSDVREVGFAHQSTSRIRDWNHSPIPWRIASLMTICSRLFHVVRRGRFSLAFIRLVLERILMFRWS